jgi:hypothetical protein
MKKRYYFLVFFGAMLGYFSVADHWFEDERDLYFPITAEQIRAGVRAQAEQNAGLTALQSAKERFNTPYKKNYERDLRQRLELLNNLAHTKAAPIAETKEFFLSLAKNKNENIVVRRQAYKNWMNLHDNKKENLVQLATFSDESMLESLTQGQD